MYAGCCHNPQLGRWVDCQRQQYKLRNEGKYSTMDGERVARLTSIGFQWSLEGATTSKSNQLNGTNDASDDDDEKGHGGNDLLEDAEDGDDLVEEQDESGGAVSFEGDCGNNGDGDLTPEHQIQVQASAINLLREEAKNLRFQLGRQSGEIDRTRKEVMRLSAENKLLKLIDSAHPKGGQQLTIDDRFQEFLDSKDDIGIDAIHRRVVEQHLRHGACVLLFPQISIMQKAGIKIDPLWDPGFLYSGEVVMKSMPGPDQLKRWIAVHRNQLELKRNDKVYIDYSEGKGKGLHAAKKINAGDMIGYYGGVIQERTEINDSKYLFSLGKSSGMEINAQYCGGMTRYINAPSEGEEANVVACVIGGERIKITAKKDLGVGDELLLDYGPEYFVDPPVGEEEED